MVREDSSLRSTVVHIRREKVPRDFIIWSTFNTVFMCGCCLGFLAYVFSIKSRDRKMVGDMAGAKANATHAKRLNIAAVIVSIIVLILIILSLQQEQRIATKDGSP